jgi:adenylate cyclase
MVTQDDNAGPRWRLPIAAFQGLVLGGLVFLTLSGVLAVTLYTVFRNTGELLEDKSRLLLASLTTATSRYLDGAQAQVDYIAGLMEQGALDPDDETRLYEILGAGLAATPQVGAVLFIDARGWMDLVARQQDGTIEHGRELWRSDPRIVTAMAGADARHDRRAYWGEPVYTQAAGTILNLRRPVHDPDFAGMVVATLRIAELSAFLTSLETESGQKAFILYDRDRVLAHRALAEGFAGLSADHPLPDVTEVGDPVLADIWSEGWQQRELEIGVGHQSDYGEDGYIFLYTPLANYADTPWLVGSYFPEEQIGVQLFRAFQATLIGVVGVVVTMIVAFFLVRTMRKPITQLAEAAGLVQDLALDRVPALPRSRLRELDDAMAAFNAMVRSLRAFALYVPRDLMRHLLARGDPAAMASETREVTVLFTDIVGFTGRTEQLSAEDTANFLNNHFALLSQCIEAERGTIDKFIGDAAMALWNATEPQPDHALRAVRTAVAIRAALGADNARQRSPVRLRIGLHSGPVVVGNIGSSTRMNYTVVGDTVNTASRIESLGRTLLPDAEVAVLLSAATAATLPATLPVTSLGCHRLRGRDAPTEVLALGDRVTAAS